MRTVRKIIGILLSASILVFGLSGNNAYGLSAQVAMQPSVSTCYIGDTFTVSFTIAPDSPAMLEATVIAPDGGLVINSVTMDTAGYFYSSVNGKLMYENNAAVYNGTISVTVTGAGTQRIQLSDIKLIDLADTANRTTVTLQECSVYVYSEAERAQQEAEAASIAASIAESSSIQESIEQSIYAEQEAARALQASIEASIAASIAESASEAASIQASIDAENAWLQASRDAEAASIQASIDAVNAWLQASREEEARQAAAIQASIDAENAWLQASRDAEAAAIQASIDAVNAAIQASINASIEESRAIEESIYRSRAAEDESVAEESRMRESIEASIAESIAASEAEVARTRAYEIDGAFFVPYDLEEQEMEERFLFAVSEETVSNPVSFRKSALVINNQDVWAYRTDDMAPGTYLVYGRFSEAEAPDFYYYTPEGELFYPYRNIHSGVLHTEEPTKATESTEVPTTVVRDGSEGSTAALSTAAVQRVFDELTGQKLLLAMLFSFLFGAAAAAIIALLVTGRKKKTENREDGFYSIDEELFGNAAGISSFEEDLEDNIDRASAAYEAERLTKNSVKTYKDDLDDMEDLEIFLEEDPEA